MSNAEIVLLVTFICFLGFGVMLFVLNEFDAGLFTLIIALILIVLFAFTNFTNKNENGKEYPKAGVITCVDEANDTVYFRDFSGHEWEFKGTEDWYVADVVAIIMCDNGTKKIEDDSIVDIKYEGSLEKWWKLSQVH